MENVQTDKHMLAQWLKCGFMENDLFHSTSSGTPQGGVISPIYANMVLDGLEAVTREATKGLTKIHVIRYAKRRTLSYLSLHRTSLNGEKSRNLRERGTF
jgi:RNA-directed DNA polymerase